MTNYVDATGIHTETLAAITADLKAQMRAIYGADINLDANSPDAQMLGIFAQAKIDLLDCIAQVYNSFSPSAAIGTVLDQRAALNGIVRQGATYTRTYITVTTDRAVNLPGLDTSTSPFTVADSTGNLFNLETTTTTGTGAASLVFRSAVAGAVATTPNTINVIATITLGVVSVNNPTSAISTGLNEETDVAFRIRRAKSVANPSRGFLEGLVGSLFAVDGVLDVSIYENVTASIDAYSVPAHSIWAIVDGGTPADIAAVIYAKRNAGCGMRGSVSETITQVDGTQFNVYFDRPIDASLYITATLTSLDAAHVIDVEWLKTQIFNTIKYRIDEPADTTSITTLIKELDPKAVVISIGVGYDGVNYESFLYPHAVSGWTVQRRWLSSTTHMTLTQV